MKMENRKKMYQELGLIGTTAATPANKFVDYPTGEIDVSRVLDGRRDCFVEPVITNAMQKKKIIVTDSLSALNGSTFTLDSFVGTLLKDGFEIYFWTGKLERLQSKDDIKRLSKKIEFIHRDALAARLPEMQLASDECYILDSYRVHYNYFYVVHGIKSESFEINLALDAYKKLPDDKIKKIMSILADDPVTIRLPRRMSDEIKSTLIKSIKQHKNISIDDTAYKYWHGDEEFWPELETLKLTTKPYNDDSLHAMLVNARRLKSLHLDHGQEINGDFVNGLAHPHLKSLYLANMRISDEQFSRWLSQSLPLVKLNLHGMNNIKGDGFDKLSWEALQELNISAPSFSSLSLHRLLSRTKVLRVLSIDSTTEMDAFVRAPVSLPELRQLTVDIGGLSISILENLLTDAAKLEKLRIHTYSKSTGREDIFNSEFKNKLNFPQLKNFSLGGYSGFNMKHLNQILANSPLLRSLNIEDCSASPNSSAEMSLGNLEELHISKCNITERQFQQMLMDAKKLKSMSLRVMHLTAENVMRDIHLPQLNSLDLGDISGSKLKLADLLKSAPELRILEIARSSFQLDLPDGDATKIKNFTCNGSGLTWVQLRHILARTPKLKSLNLISNNKLIDSYDHSELATLSKLKKLTLTSPVRDDQLQDLLNHAPHLKTFVYTPASSYVDISEWNVPELQFLEIEKAKIDGNAIYHLSERAPLLEDMKMDSCNFTNANLGLSPQFKHVKTLSLRHSYITDQKLHVLVSGMPKLKTLSLSGCTNLSSFFETFASTTVEDLDLSYHRIKPDTIDGLLQRCPNIKTLHLYQCPMGVEDVRILKKKYPKVKFYQFYTSSYRQGFVLDGYIYDEDKESTANNNMLVSEVFHTHQYHYPEVRDYRTEVFTGVTLDALTGKVKFTRADGTRRVNVECDTSRENLLAEFSSQDQSNQNKFVGESYYDAATFNWHALDSLSPNDKLIAIETIPQTDIDICYDQDESLYFIKPKQSGKKFHITYVLEHQREKDLDRAKSFDFGRQYPQINRDGSLKVDDKTQALLDKMSYESKVSCLAAYLSVDRKSMDNKNEQIKNDLDIINAILKYRVGACRHISAAFMLLAKAMNIKARMVTNACHAYVEVWLNNKWQKIDLGGWDTDLIVSPVRSDYRALLSSAVPVVQPQNLDLIQDDEPPVEHENRFAVWNSYQSTAATAEDYVNELCAQTDALQAGEKNILSVLNETQIESLHAAFQRRAAKNGTHCYYVHHLDDIRESSYLLDQASGEFIKHDSELVNYIKHAKPGDVLMVNWSDYESAHVGFNTMLDAERSLFGIPIPPGVTVVGLLANGKTLGEDFYSRYRLVSDCPERIANQPLVLPEMKTINKRSHFQEIIFYERDWKQQWYGNYQVQNQSFQFINSAIDQAVAENKNGVVLRNAPWDLPEFRLAVTELMTTRKLYVNGEYRIIPDNFMILRDDTPLSLWTGNYQIIKTLKPAQVSYVLNMATKQQFYPGFTCLDNGALSQSPGLLAQHKGKRLSILVADQFSHAAWAKLLEEANKHRVKLVLYAKPDTVFPEDMLKYSAITNISPLKRSKSSTKFKAAVISTNDIEMGVWHASRQDQDVIRIPVNALTTYSDLIERIDVEDINGRKLFKNTTSVLADAILDGKKIILTGEISPLLARQLAPLFCAEPYLILNGKFTPILKGKVTLVSTQENNELCVVKEKHDYDDEARFAALSNDGDIDLLKSVCSAFYALVPDYPHFSYAQLKEMLARMQSMPTANPLTPWLRLDKQYETLKPHASQAWEGVIASRNWFKRRRLEKPAKQFVDHMQPIAKRLRKVMEELRSGPFVFVAGSSGIGKSRFVENDLLQEYPDFNLFSGMDHLKEWLAGDKRKTNILFIDEANLLVPGTFDIFAGLMQTPPVILLDGKLHELGEHHKIIFAGNFSQYKNRHQHDFFRTYGHVITFKEFPDTFLIKNIIMPVLSECIPFVSQANPNRLADYYLQAYHHINTKFPDTHPVTARNLQMMAMRTARYIRARIAPEISATLAVYDELCGMLKKSERRELREWLRVNSHRNVDIKLIKNVLKEKVDTNILDFHLAKNRRNPIRQLDDLFALREMKLAKPALVTAGTAGILFEGESGIGKSKMVKTYLVSHGFVPAESADEHVSSQRKFYHLTPTDPLKMKAVLVKAFHEGAVVIIDELNSLPLEHILNPLLSGVDPDGRKATLPGFFVIGTQNPASFAKRQILSGALLNRVQNINLKDYGKADMLEIVSKHAPGNHELKEMVDEFSAARLFAKANHKMMPTLRHLIAAACKKG